MPHKQSGFTLIELLMAMALFSGMLVIISMGFIQAVRLYRNSIGNRETQTSVRYGMDELLRDSREAMNATTPAGHTEVCLQLPTRTVRYYRTGSGTLMRADKVSCTAPADVAGTASKVSADGVNVVSFTATASTGQNPGYVTYVLRISSSDSSGLDSAGKCRPGLVGSEFCSTTEIKSTASLRGEAQ